MANSKTTKTSIVKKKKKKSEKDKLTPKQNKFCLFFATDSECFGNATQTYIKVFSSKKKPITYKTARTQASVLLTNPNILARVNKYMDEFIMNNVTVDRQLGFLIEQHADFGSKLGAIREFNKLRKRISEAPAGTKEMPFHIIIEKADDESTIKRQGGEKDKDVQKAV
jgi:hypothetical protein